MNQGPQSTEKRNFIDFLRTNWLEGDYTMLYNTISQVDHQRRAFSHDGVRIDIFKPDTDSHHADAFMAKIPELTKPGECLTLPFDEEKLTKLYALFDDVTKDITADPKWNEFWTDWEKGFVAAVKASPKEYLKGDQLKAYLESPHDTAKNLFLKQLMYDHKQAIQNRVKGAYLFKMLTELYVAKKLTKEMAVTLQTIANHSDELSPKGMQHYLDDKHIESFKNKVVSFKDTLFNLTTLSTGENTSLSDDELEAATSKMLNGWDDDQGNHHEGLKETGDFKALDPTVAEQLLQDIFLSSTAKDLLKDELELKGFYNSLRNDIDDYLEQHNLDKDPDHKTNILELKKLLLDSSMGHVYLSIDKETFKESILGDKTKVRALLDEVELNLAQRHMAKNLDQWISSFAHDRKTMDDLEADFKQMLLKDTVNQDHMPVAYILEHQLEQWKNQSPTLEELRDLKLIMESDPSETNRQAYYEALTQAEQLESSVIKEGLGIASIKHKWRVKFQEGLGGNGAVFMKEARENLERFALPMDENKVISLFMELSDLDDDLLDSMEFNGDIARLPKEWQEQAKQDLLAQYREHILKNCHFYAGSDLSEPEKKQKESQLQNVLLELNQTFAQTLGDGQKAYDEIRQGHEQYLQKRVETLIKETRENVLKGKTLDQAIKLCENNIKMLTDTSAFAFLGESKGNQFLIPLKELKDDYEEVLKLINTQLEYIGEHSTPKGGQSSGKVVQDLIKESASIIESSKAFQRRPHVSAEALRRQILSDDAQNTIKQKAHTARVEYFTGVLERRNPKNPISETMRQFIEHDQKGLRWIRFRPARRAVIQDLAEAIKNGGAKFKKPNAFERGLGIEVYPAQRDAIKALQKEYMECVKYELAQCETAQEALELIEKVKKEPMMKALPRSTFASLFQPKNRSAKNELEALEAKIKANLSAKPNELKELKVYSESEQAKDKSIYSANTSVESDVSIALSEQIGKRLSQVVEDYPVDKAQVSNQLTDEQQLREQQLLVPTEHEQLKASLLSIKDPYQRREEINRLFATMQLKEAKSDGFFKKSPSYSTQQKEAIVLLQDLYLHTVKEQVHLATWRRSGQAPNPFNPDTMVFSVDNIHCDQLPEELSDQDKNDIYREVLASCKHDPLVLTEAKPGRKEHMLNALSNLNEVVNHIFNKGTSPEMKRYVDNSEVERLNSRRPKM